MWPIATIVLLSASPVATCCGPRTCTHVTAGQPSRSFDSTSFQVKSSAVGCDACTLAQCCESWRQHLCARWLGDETPSAWKPRCIVIVHARRESYRAAIGRGGGSVVDLVRPVVFDTDTSERGKAVDMAQRRPNLIPARNDPPASISPCPRPRAPGSGLLILARLASPRTCGSAFRWRSPIPRSVTHISRCWPPGCGLRTCSGSPPTWGE